MIPIYEEIVEPALEIYDPHHHLWDLSQLGVRDHFPYLETEYLFPDFLADTRQGHRITKTVFLQCYAFHRADGPKEMAPLGEVEFANGVAAMGASGNYGELRPCAGIVSRADLILGDAVEPVLEAQRRAAGDRLKGVRNVVAHDPTGSVFTAGGTLDGNLYSHPDFRAGFARLAAHGLTFDAYCYHSQLDEVIALARAFPDQPIVLDHLGTPISVGAYAGRRDEIFADWRASMTELAGCANVSVKLSGLGMTMLGFDLPDRASVPSRTVAAAWAPYVETCIALFGVDRCMFASNFPVDSFVCGYGIMWNAYKHITAGYSADEKDRLYRLTAKAFYSL